MAHKEAVENFNNEDYISENLGLWEVDVPTGEYMAKIPEGPDHEYQIFKHTLQFKLDEYADIKYVREEPELLRKNIALLEPVLEDYKKYQGDWLNGSDDNPHGLIDLDISYAIDGDRENVKFLLSHIIDEDMFIKMISERLEGLKKKLQYTERFLKECDR